MNPALPVKITAVDKQRIYFTTLNNPQTCPKCAAGQGCGSVPWFRGIKLKSTTTLSLPLSPNQHPFKVNDHAQLSLAPTAVNYLSLISYGLPLIGFLLGILLTLWTNNEILQFSTAIIGLISGISLSRPLSHHLLKHHLTLSQTISNQQPEYHSPDHYSQFKMKSSEK